MPGRPRAVRSMVVTAGLVAVALALAAPRAEAEKKVSSMGKGIVGLGLLSGEVVLSVEALAGVKNGWALAIPTIVAAGGGATGGYFIDRLDKPEVSVALLASGLALFIPSIIIAVARTKYVSEKDLAEDTGVVVTEGAGEEIAGPPAEGTETEPGTEPETETEAEPAAPPEPEVEESGSAGTVPLALLGVDRTGLRVGLPPLEVVDLYSDDELRFLARAQGVEYRLALLHIAF